MRLALAQLNPVVGEVAGNVAAILGAYRDAVAAGADVVLTGELAISGYPPEDLLLKPAFLKAVAGAVEELAAATGDTALVVGFPEDLRASAGAGAQTLANAAAVLRDGRIEAVYRKQRIPNYGVFDEARYFRPLQDVVTFDAAGTIVGVTVCEDMWGEGGPLASAAAAGAEVILSLNASPYHRGKRAEREHWARLHATRSDAVVAWCNLVGGQDEVVFDGDSFVVDGHGKVVGRAAQFEPDLLVVDVPDRGPVSGGPRLEPPAETYAALVLGTRDYVRKNGFGSVLLGLSGGIDSALTAAVAVDALGADHVFGVAMPSPHSSAGSLTDAKALAATLGITWLQLPIERIMTAFASVLAEPFSGLPEDVTEENIQSRIRGVLLMALSNKLGHLLLTTGNKSEYAVGYATLYGDMAGGFAPIKDVWKTAVYQLCRYRNAHRLPGWLGPEGPVISDTVLGKPPSAELRPGQLDTDSLPSYDLLDEILERYVEQDQAVDDIIAAGFDAATTSRVVRMVDQAEYKRRQSAPGVKITRRAFGRDRRLPITNCWRR